MSAKAFPIFTTLVLLFAFNARATVRYVDLNSTNATPPYLNWNTAATNIQNAIDAAVDGDLVLVTNGVYATGGRVVYGLLTNRVVVNKAVIVQSVNGPALTFIKGFQVPGTTNGNNAVRCVYLTNNATLIGFALTNGATRNAGDANLEQSGGGAWCESGMVIISNCIALRNSANQFGGGVFYGNMFNCVLNANRASQQGGGAYSSTLENCTVSSNSAFGQFPGGGGLYGGVARNCAFIGNFAKSVGGGAAFIHPNVCVLINCSLVGNSAGSGGGTAQCSLTNCTLSGNSAGVPGTTGGEGGGAQGGTLYNCILTGNIASANGGGVDSCTLYHCTLASNYSPSGGGASYCLSQYSVNNCTLIDNIATNSGGGAYFSILNNCTLSGNIANSGGGVSGGTLKNCIVYYNAALSSTNYDNAPTFSNCSTTPQAAGVGNFTNAPLFLNITNDFHLQPNSPCINAGNNTYAPGDPDSDGNPRIVGGTVDIGAYEFQSPSSILSYAWAQQFGLPTDGSADFADTDGDGLNNWQEWIAGTVPTNSLSVLTMFSPSNNVPGLKVSWQSVSGKNYFLQRSTDLLAQPAFSAIKSNLVGQAGTTVYADITATNTVPYFYRVGVQ
jgi:parallel beta-helix repeat protein